MADIVNLNRVRKAKAKEEAQSRAKANRLIFGRPKAVKDEARLRAELAERELDGKRIDGPKED